MKKYAIVMFGVNFPKCVKGVIDVKDGQMPYVRAQMAYPELRHGGQWTLVRT